MATEARQRAPIILATIARAEGTTGVQTHMRELNRFMAKRGDQFEIVTPHKWARGARWRLLVLPLLFGARLVLERVYGPAHVWWYRSSHEFFLRQALRTRLAREGCCTVYAQCPVSAKAALAARTGPHQRVVLAVHFRTSQSDEWADKGLIPRHGRVYRWIRGTERRVVPDVDGLVFVSSWARLAVCSWMPEVETVAGTVIPNFVNVGRVPARPPRAGCLVTVGSLERVKNHRYLLQVLAAASAMGHRYTLDVFGEGVEHDRLVALAEHLGVGEQVRFHGFRRDLPQLLPGHSAYVHASYSESSSLAIMEAMAAGLPVVSSGEGALTELFDAPEHGRFWPIDDVPAAARTLIELMESPEELRRAGDAARRKFSTDYDAEVVVPRLLRFLRSPEDVSDEDPGRAVDEDRGRQAR